MRCPSCDHDSAGRRFRALECESKQVTVLFADVKGSMSLAAAAKFCDRG